MHQPFYDDEFQKHLDNLPPNELRLLWVKMTLQLMDEIDTMVHIDGVKEAADYLNRFFE
jgi:hypothetical protein